MGDYSKYDVHNADLHTDRAYLFSKDLFPLAFVEINKQNTNLNYTLKDDVTSTDYLVPPLRIIEAGSRHSQKRLQSPNLKTP